MKYPKRVFTYRYDRAGDPCRPGTVVVVARVEQRARLAAERKCPIGDLGSLELVDEEPLREPLPGGAQVVFATNRGSFLDEADDEAPGIDEDRLQRRLDGWAAKYGDS